MTVKRYRRHPVNLRAALVAASGLALMAPVRHASAAPDLQWVFPAGGQRGATVTAEVHGTGLAHLSGVFLTGSGVSAEVLPGPATYYRDGKTHPLSLDQARLLKLTIAPDAALGSREIRVFEPGGISMRKIFRVGQWPEIEETEPNDTPEAAQVITPPVTINGQFQQPSDQDCYRLTCKAGQEVVCEVYSDRLLANIGESSPEGLLEILDPHGKLIAQNDGRFHWDAFLTFTAAEGGDYIVRFRDLLWRGSPSAVYRLTVGSMPYATTIFPTGVQRGQASPITFAGINLGAPAPLMVKALPSDTSDVLDASLPTPAGLTNPMRLRVDDCPQFVQQDPNDTPAQANRVTVPVGISGRLEHDGARAVYVFYAEAKQRLSFEVYSFRAGSPLDSYLTLTDSKGTILRENDDYNESDSLIDYTFPAAGDYLIQIRDVDDRGGPDFTYHLTISTPRPDFQLWASPDIVAAPLGGAAAIDVGLDRKWGFNEEVKVHVEGLPPGLRASSAIIAPGSDHVVIGVERVNSTAASISGPMSENGSAASGARPTTRQSPTNADMPGETPYVVRVVGDAEVGGQATSRTATALEAYLIQNRVLQRPVTAAVALESDASPFQLEASPAAIHLAQGAATDLSVHIIRRAGATGSLTLHVDGLPRGVSAEPVVAVADTAALVLKAADDAPASAVDMVVVGTQGRPDGRPGIVSPLIRMDVVTVPIFALTATPEAITLAPGQSFTLHAAIVRREGFTGTVDLAVHGLPAGITADPARIGENKDEATLILKAADQDPKAVSGARPARSCALTVQGTGALRSERQNIESGKISLTIE